MSVNTWSPSLPPDLLVAKREVYDHFQLHCTLPQEEKESKEYGACTFTWNDKKVVFRTAKITPTKSGQFVTTWKRQGDGPIEPFNISDALDLLVIGVRREAQMGQFIFPKTELVKRGIITANRKEGKRGLRVYPPWDHTQSMQARNTQSWQLRFFLHIQGVHAVDKQRAIHLYTSMHGAPL